MPQSFDTLHDATLVHLELAWETGEVTFHLRTATNPAFRLLIEQVTALTATRTFAWGPSAQINAISVSGDAVVVEMQSGDTITLTGQLNTAEGN